MPFRSSLKHLIAKKRELSEQTGRDVAMLCFAVIAGIGNCLLSPVNCLQDYGLGSKSIRQTQSCEPKLCLLHDLELWVLLGVLRVVDQFPPASLPNSSKAYLLL
jgi:hypothetical protein